jgi:hypothetical protein
MARKTKGRKKLIGVSAYIKSNSHQLMTLEGRDYYVFRIVPLVEGVHHGNGPGGRVMYWRSELNKYTPAWNHKPIVIDHPQRGGKYVSADDPEILNESKVGFLMRNRMKRDQQWSEAWLAKKRADRMIPDIVRNLKSGKRIEVSTGLFATFDAKPGTWNGEKYDGSASEFRPDHLAILTDTEGACSVKDGCGMFQSKKEKSTKNKRMSCNCGTSNKCSCLRKPKMKKTSKKSKMSALMQRRKKNKLVKSLIASEAFDEDEEDVLKKLPYATLQKMQTLAEKAEDEEEDYVEEEDIDDSDEDDAEDESKKGKKKLAATNKKKEDNLRAKLESILNGNGKTKASVDKEVEAFLAKAPKKIQSVFRRALEVEEAQKRRYTDIVLSNENNVFTKKELAKMEPEQLQKLAALAVSNASELDDDDDDEDSAFNYAGSIGAPLRSNSGGKEESPLELPQMNHDLPKKKKEDSDD